MVKFLVSLDVGAAGMCFILSFIAYLLENADLGRLFLSCGFGVLGLGAVVAVIAVVAKR